MPDGTIHSSVTVRDIAYNPISGSWVYIDYSGCSVFRPCPTACTSCTVDLTNNGVSRFTLASGVADFDLCVGGSSCPNPPQVRVYADGVLLAQPRFVSLDFDGDETVTPADQAAVHALIGSSDLRADFTGDGAVTAADEALLAAHLGATCDPATPVRTNTWGRLKAICR